MGHGENSRSPQAGQTGAGREEREEKTRENMITMVTDSGESVDFYVLEETRINARSYLLVTDAPEGEDGECYILKDMSGQQDAEAVYEFVEDDSELDALMKVFEELLSDADVDLEK